MITYKNTHSNVGSSGITSFQRPTNFNSKIRKANVESSKSRVDHNDFDTIVLALMSALQGEAKTKTSHSDALDHFFKLLRYQLAEKNPSLDDIINLIDNTKI